MVTVPVCRQKMIVKHIGHHRRIMPKLRTESLLAAIHYGMRIGEVVYSPMQFDTRGNAGSKPFSEVPSLHKIANKIAHHDLGIVAGKIQMGQEVHCQNYGFAEHAGTIQYNKRPVCEFICWNISGDFTISEVQKKAMTAIEKIKLLVSLAAIDGTIADREKSYIINIGLANGVPANELEEIVNRRHDIVVPANLSDSEKFDFLFHLIQLMKIDEKMYREELLFCSTIAEKLGYRKEVLFDLMLNVKAREMDDSEKQQLEAETKKYLTK